MTWYMTWYIDLFKNKLPSNSNLAILNSFRTSTLNFAETRFTKTSLNLCIKWISCIHHKLGGFHRWGYGLHRVPLYLVVYSDQSSCEEMHHIRDLMFLFVFFCLFVCLFFHQSLSISVDNGFSHRDLSLQVLKNL